MSKFWKMSGSVMELSSEATSERTGSGHGRSHNIRYRREPSHEDEVKDIVLERQLIDVRYLVSNISNAENSYNCNPRNEFINH